MTTGFLSELFGSKKPSDKLLIWAKDKPKGGTSHWFTDPEEAEAFAIQSGDEFDVYFGIGLASRSYGKSQRVKASDVAAVPGVWIEVDFKTGSTDIHKKEDRLPTEEEALALIRKMHLKASVVVFSGHGFHVYWLFDKLWQFADADERERAKRLVERWQRYFKSMAEQHNWAFDSTFDLARVYRVPGTKNHKGKEPSAVVIVEMNEGRYTVEQIEGFLDSLPVEERPQGVRAEETREIRERMAEAGALRLAPDAEVNLAKFELLCEAEPRFRLTWEKQRKELIDQSSSSYDMALANYAARAGWDDQEIVNLIIAFRREHGDDLKLRQDYYSMTIAKARKAAQVGGANNGHPSPSFSTGSKAQPVPFPELHTKALYGLAGMIVCTILPHTEAHPAALLLQFLAAFGNVIGRTAYFSVEATRHYLLLFTVLVGLSSKGRKGTSWEQILRLFRAAEEAWVRDCVQSGLSSGEGLIWAVRDPIEQKKQVVEKGRPTNEHRTFIVDYGVADKRLLVIEPEFASVLRMTAREGNTLSPLLRQAWDSGNIRSMTKNSPARATGAHISTVGHITKDELLRNLDETETANGFANRFLWAAVKRSKLLPEGGNLKAGELNPLISGLRSSIQYARSAGEMRRDEEARALWFQVYERLSTGHNGLFGAITSRAEAQVMRLACLYALLDRSATVRRVHLEAALALWRYCEDSARFIFGDATGDRIADSLLAALREAGAQGLSKTDLSNILGRNANAARINQSLNNLSDYGLARSEKQPNDGGGRPTERWFAVIVERPNDERNEVNEFTSTGEADHPVNSFTSSNSYSDAADEERSERAAIMEVDGGVIRSEAERAARLELEDVPF